MYLLLGAFPHHWQTWKCQNHFFFIFMFVLFKNSANYIWDQILIMGIALKIIIFFLYFLLFLTFIICCILEISNNLWSFPCLPTEYFQVIQPPHFFKYPLLRCETICLIKTTSSGQIDKYQTSCYIHLYWLYHQGHLVWSDNPCKLVSALLYNDSRETFCKTEGVFMSHLIISLPVTLARSTMLLLKKKCKSRAWYLK